MTDISKTIAPKSTQTNADDLIAGPRTIRVTAVKANSETKDQPIAISYEGDDGKHFLPCLSMRRVLVQVWGRDGNQYVGKQMTLYRDPTVKFGGAEVGGIRISHMSGIDKPITMALTATRASRKPYTVRPLEVEQASFDAEKELETARIEARKGRDALQAHWATLTKEKRALVNAIMDELKELASPVAEEKDPPSDNQTLGDDE